MPRIFKSILISTLNQQFWHAVCILNASSRFSFSSLTLCILFATIIIIHSKRYGHHIKHKSSTFPLVCIIFIVHVAHFCYYDDCLDFNKRRNLFQLSDFFIYCACMVFCKLWLIISSYYSPFYFFLPYHHHHHHPLLVDVSTRLAIPLLIFLPLHCSSFILCLCIFISSIRTPSATWCPWSRVSQVIQSSCLVKILSITAQHEKSQKSTWMTLFFWLLLKGCWRMMWLTKWHERHWETRGFFEWKILCLIWMEVVLMCLVKDWKLLRFLNFFHFFKIEVIFWKFKLKKLMRKFQISKHR